MCWHVNIEDVHLYNDVAYMYDEAGGLVADDLLQQRQSEEMHCQGALPPGPPPAGGPAGGALRGGPIVCTFNVPKLLVKCENVATSSYSTCSSGDAFSSPGI